MSCAFDAFRLSDHYRSDGLAGGDGSSEAFPLANRSATLSGNPEGHRYLWVEVHDERYLPNPKRIGVRFLGRRVWVTILGLSGSEERGRGRTRRRFGTR